jgi:phospholipid/cholesterol/gamma-HCH transport system ATP-binding protein
MSRKFPAAAGQNRSENVAKSAYDGAAPDETVQFPTVEPYGGENTVVINDLYKAFGGFEVMRGLDLAIPSKAITTVLGPSGTGKSVLLKHIMGLLKPDYGKVNVFGKNLWELSDAERYDLRKRCGLLFQDGALFGSMNVFDNVAYPLRQHTDFPEDRIERIVMSRLGEVGLEKAASKAPGELSGGMRKRAGFARALVLNPELVMFDEPDSGLDPVRTSILCDLILDMHSEHRGTYVIITHDIASARKVSDYVAVIWQGKIVDFSPAEVAFDSPNPFVRQFLAGASVGPLGMD